MTTNGLVQCATNACNITIPARKPPPAGKTPVHWGNSEISAAQVRYVRYRNTWFRARRLSEAVPGNTEITAAAETVYRSTSRDLKQLIRTAKPKCWEDLIKTVEMDSWDKPFKFVTGKLRGFSVMGSLEPGKIESITRALFPSNSRSRANPLSPLPGVDGDGTMDMPKFSAAEVADAVSRYRSRDRVPGPDGITNHIWGIVHDTRLRWSSPPSTRT